MFWFCVSEYDFMRVKPSTIAISCVISAIKGLKTKIDCEIFRHLCALTSSPVEQVKDAVNRLEWIFAKEASVTAANKVIYNNCGAEKNVPVSSDDEKSTDVHDVDY